MSPFEVYITYLALKRHFTSESYDFHKYNGKINASIDAFKARKDCFFFEKLAKHQNPKDFLLANIIVNPTAYVRDLAYDEKYKIIYNKWLKTKESLTYVFQTEITNLHPDFNSNFLCTDGNHPILLRLFLGEKISLETLSILCNLTGCLKHWDQQLEGDIVYKDVGLLVKKYKQFLQYDKEKFKKIIRNKI